MYCSNIWEYFTLKYRYEMYIDVTISDLIIILILFSLSLMNLWQNNHCGISGMYVNRR